MNDKFRLLIIMMILTAVLLTGCHGQHSAVTPVEDPACSDAPISSGPDLYSVGDLRKNPQTKDLFFSDFSSHTAPKGLLTIVFNYNNGYYNASDDELEKVWSDYIFGADNGEASVNDYFREVSQGRFWFEPITVGDNKSGVHVVHLDKDYSDAQFCHEDYPFFDFSYDAATVLDDLISQGLDINRFKAADINHDNFEEVLMQYFDSTQDMRPSQWFETDALIFVFPAYNSEKVDLTPLSTDFSDYGLYSHVCQTSTLGTIVHELTHTLGAVDVYNYCYVNNDLMSKGYDKHETDATSHMNPYYKLIWGWCSTQLATDDCSVKLYPATSASYSPVLIPSEDPNQYFLLENRRAEGYDNYLTDPENGTNYEGLSVWRVDKLALEKIYSDRRKGISMECVLKNEGESCELLYYASSDDLENDALVGSGIVIEFADETPDYIEIRVDYQK